MTVKPMLPVVLSENVVNLFKFYMDGSIREGMRYNDELYVLAHKFPGSHWLKGYQIACELAAMAAPRCANGCATLRERRNWLRSLLRTIDMLSGSV
ncbi:MAG: hypothetical protein GDA56_30030 [Hormoscilla sp. GM7CHS1pb]|nr:hypothetical protein [Hormoscilla sp. GM7CHS1pb]